ncbi:DMT family transporter [Candidatus Nitrosoglobus terrae]|nr:DMT family transporter [Candidatus Nitrosoglobus terrae]
MTNNKPVLALVVLVLIWGYSWIVTKQALFWSAPLDFAALRSIFGGLCLLPVIIWQGGSLQPLYIKSMLWLALLQTVGFLGCSALALAEGAVGRSIVLAYTMPLWAVIFAAWFLGERLYHLQWLALGLASLGLIGIINPWEANFTLASTLFALAAGLWWGISVVVSKRLKLNNTLELLNVTAWQMLLGGILLEVLAYFIPSKPITWNAPFLWALAYAAILTSALGWLLWLYVLQKLSASVTGLSSLAVPVISMALAWLILDEIPTLGEMVGMLLILTSLTILSLAALRYRS